MVTGDEALIYHSGSDRAIVGIARVIRGAYPDPKLGDPRRVVIDVQAHHPLKRAVPLSAIKADPRLAALALVRISRLSCMPVSAEHRAVLRQLGVR